MINSDFQGGRCALLAGSALLALMLPVTAALSQSESSRPPTDRSGRYTFQQTQEGVLRFDTQSGEISVCRSRDGRWACEAATDDRRSVEEEVVRLRAENAELKKDVKRLEELAGIPNPPDPEKLPGTGRAPGGVQLPTEEDLDKAMTYMQRMLKKFKDKLKEFENELGKVPEPKKGTQL